MKNDLMARARVSGIFIAGIVVCVGLSVLCALTEQTAWLGVIAVLLAAAILGCLRKLQVDLHHTYKRLESWHALHAMVPLAAMPPAPRPWAASPELLRTVVELVTLDKPRLVLELGSGSSTIWIAAALAPSGAGQVVSLDHEEQFAQATQRSLAQHQLTNARVLHAPLVPTVVQGMANDKTFRWYDTAGLADVAAGSVDLLVVDGPPGRDQPLARLPALPCLDRWLSDRAVIVLDDAARSDELRIADLWCAYGAGWVAEARDTEKGVIIFRRRNAKNS